MPPEEAVWRIDPDTLREVVLKPQVLLAWLDAAAAVERIWILQALGRLEQAAEEGHALVGTASDPLRP